VPAHRLIGTCAFHHIETHGPSSAKRKEGRWHFYRLAGNDGTKETQGPLAWMFKSLETEGTIRKDAEMMSRVREKGLVAPCVYYRS
jgi:hypothetical protein